MEEASDEHLYQYRYHPLCLDLLPVRGMVADGAAKRDVANILFVAGCVAIILSILWLLVMYYERILRWCLDNRWKFMLIPGATIVFGFWIWRGIGQEFMPSLNEGSFY